MIIKGGGEGDKEGVIIYIHHLPSIIKIYNMCYIYTRTMILMCYIFNVKLT